MINRILGILVVLALGILIYPFAFSSHDHWNARSNTIQLPPFPSPQTQNATLKALNQNSEMAVSKTEIKEKKPTNGKTPYKNVAWVIQVGSYHDKVKALTLVNQLRAKGYNAFIHQSNAAFGKETQVYVGPEAKKDSAKSLASKLAKDLRLSAEIKSYKMLSV